MNRFLQRLLGALLALALLALALLHGPGAFFAYSPIFFMAFLSFSFPPSGQMFLLTYLMGLAVGRLAFENSTQSWVVPEMFALAALYWAPTFIRKNQTGIREKYLAQFEARKSDYEAFREDA